MKKFSANLKKGRKRILDRTISKNFNVGLLKVLKMDKQERNVFNDKRDQMYMKDNMAELNAQIEMKH